MIERSKNRLVCTLAINMGECINLTRRPMRLYAQRVNADFHVWNKTDRDPPHLAKYDLLQTAHKTGYEQILYVDADVYIRRGVPNIFEHYTNALFNETPSDGYFEAHHHKIAREMRELISDYNLTDPYYNTGVMIFNAKGLERLCSVYSNDTSFQTYGAYFEQHQLNAFLKRAELPEQQLSRRWNSFASNRLFTDRFLLNSYFVHVPGLKTLEQKAAKLKQIKNALP